MRADRGEFEVELLDFEDAGARWVVELWRAGDFQFARGSERRASIDDLERAVAWFDRPLTMDRAPYTPDLAEQRAHAATFLPDSLELDLAAATGSPAAQAALQAFMEARGLAEIEEAFATRYVRNPGSGELVKGHRIVIAGLGLAAFEGRHVRDPKLFEGEWSGVRRADHVLSRIAFVRELFARAGLARVTLWRGLAADGPLRPHPPRTFVSASFDRAVAESLFRGAADTQVAVLYRQAVPIDRLFMTFLETAAMNRQYLEREAVLFADPENLAF